MAPMSPNERDLTLDSWVHELPKIELHLHLEGSMSVDTVRALAARHRADPTRVWPDGLPPSFSFVDFPDFAQQFFFGLSLLRTGDDLATITEDLAVTLAGQNVRYAEITTTAYTHFMDHSVVDGVERVAMSRGEYSEGLAEGRRRAADRGVEISWVVDIPRDLEMPDSMATVDFLDGPEAPDGLVAIGLGGYETGFPAAPYADHFARAKAMGLRSVPHAGETEGADSVRSALEDLGADRIGHGVRCLEDPAVVEMLVEGNVMLEVCPTSNELLGVIDSLDSHPLPQLRDAGVRVCLNTDDPGWFATDLETELLIASRSLGVDRESHKAMQLDAVAASFAAPELAAAMASEIRDFPV